MCGRRMVDREYPNLAIDYGDMDFKLLEMIAPQIHPGIVVQFHRDGEALLYPEFGRAMRLFPNNIRNIVTNGKLLVQKADEIIGNLETMSISVFGNDEEADEQKELLEEFLKIKKERKPYVTLRLIGDIDSSPYDKYNLQIIRRVLHSPMGSFGYVKRKPVIPEIGICWDFLNHPCVNRKGDFSICVRFDPSGIGILGNLSNESLHDMWNSERRTAWKKCHIEGRRNDVPLCEKCEYWGVPIAP
jgi:radical SAM protein with 4Fe4S-binding SPASM domain